MAKFSIEGTKSGLGSGVLSIKPNSSNDTNSVHRGILKIFQVTKDSEGKEVRTLRKTINLTQNKKGSSSGGSGSTEITTVYAIEIWDSGSIAASAPDSFTNNFNLLFMGGANERRNVQIQCYSAQIDPSSGAIDQSTKKKETVSVEKTDEYLTLNTSTLNNLSVALSDSILGITNTKDPDTGTTRNSNVVVYPSAMVNNKKAYSLNISVIIVSSNIPVG